MADQGVVRIFSLATECDGLLARFVASTESSYLSQASELSESFRPMGRLAKDWQDRFTAWSSYLGVFAEDNVSLDHRLDNNPDIRRMIIKLLEVLDLNLRTVIHTLTDGDKYHGLGGLSNGQDFLARSQEQRHFVEGSIDRLHRLGVTIRRSSMASLRSRVDAFAAKSSSPIEELCSKAIKHIYPLAPESLQDHLIQSVLQRYFTLLYRQKHQRRISRRRPVSRQELDTDQGAEDKAAVVTSAPGPALVPRTAPDKIQESHSEGDSKSGTKPSTLKTDEFIQKIRIRQGGPSATRGSATSMVSSAPADHLLYPKPPKGGELAGFVSCSWCFEPLLTSQCKEARKRKSSSWWRRHVDRDLTPYVCLAENCAKPPPTFDRRSTWTAHMTQNHSANWTREIHRERRWVCNINHLVPLDDFSTQKDLTLHMHKDHGESFTARQIESIIRRRSDHLVREEGVCPFQCSYNAAQDASLTNPPSQYKATDKVSSSETTSPNSQKRSRLEKLEQRKRPRRVQFAEHTFMPDDMDESDYSTDKEQNNRNEVREEPLQRALSRHIATHLLSISFLTVRFKDLRESSTLYLDDEVSTVHLSSAPDDTSDTSRHSRHDSDLDEVSLNFDDSGPVFDDAWDATQSTEEYVPAMGDISEWVRQSRREPSPPSRDPNFQKDTEETMIGLYRGDLFGHVPHKDCDSDSAMAVDWQFDDKGEWSDWPIQTPALQLRSSAHETQKTHEHTYVFPSSGVNETDMEGVGAWLTRTEEDMVHIPLPNPAAGDFEDLPRKV